jgi:hypothetical protein
MADQKTKPTAQPVEDFLNNLADEKVRDDCFQISRLMKKATGAAPKMWGTGIVGFGSYHYKYESGHEGDSCLTGFSPRKQNITLYVMPGFTAHPGLLQKLGKHKAGKGCLYIKTLQDLDMKVLEQLIDISVSALKKKYGNK